jgi:hypothetical protein
MPKARTGALPLADQVGHVDAQGAATHGHGGPVGAEVVMHPGDRLPGLPGLGGEHVEGAPQGLGDRSHADTKISEVKEYVIHG